MKTTILSIKSYSRLELTFTDGLMDKQTLLFNNIDFSQENKTPYYIVTLEYLFMNPKDALNKDVANMERYVSMFSEILDARSPSFDIRRYKAHTKIELLNVAYTLLGVFPREFRISDTSAILELHIDHVTRE